MLLGSKRYLIICSIETELTPDLDNVMFVSHVADGETAPITNLNHYLHFLLRRTLSILSSNYICGILSIHTVNSEHFQFNWEKNTPFASF